MPKVTVLKAVKIEIGRDEKTGRARFRVVHPSETLELTDVVLKTLPRGRVVTAGGRKSTRKLKR